MDVLIYVLISMGWDGIGVCIGWVLWFIRWGRVGWGLRRVEGG